MSSPGCVSNWCASWQRHRPSRPVRSVWLRCRRVATLAGLDAAVLVSRAQVQGLSRKVLEGILSADASKLPAVVGVDAGEGAYIIARIDKLLPRDPAIIDDKRAAEQYAQAWCNAESLAYYDALKTQFKAVLKAPQVAASSPAP